jgi:benzaldehyde dehydrogenase (NAD)
VGFLDDGTWSGLIFSDGWHEAYGGARDVIEPASGDTLGKAGLANAADVEQACAKAAKAQPEWARTPFQERAAILRRAGQLFEQHAEDIHWWLVRESGSIPPMAGLNTHIAAQECYEAAALPSHPLGRVLPSEQPRFSIARRVPSGVVGVIAPFNAPLILGIRSVAPALALGNAVVFKPDPRTAVCGGVAIAGIFEEAGLPPGVLHMLPGGPDAGEALVSDPHVRVISFTGSTAAGRKVAAVAARSLKRVHLELGGNSAMIVLDDVDVDRAASAGAFGSFMHQGQICMTTGRHIVHEKVADSYIEAMTEKAKNLPVGNPATEQVALGPVIDAAQRDKIHQLVTSSVSSGARLTAGGTYDNLFYRPTVLTDVDADTAAYAQEVFGPVAPIVRFSTVEEAAQLAAATEYGLSLGILTRDPLKGLEIAERIPSGIVHINDQTVSDEAQIPFGGVGASGTGSRFGGAEANIEAFTEAQWVTMRSEIPAYPF